MFYVFTILMIFGIGRQRVRVRSRAHFAHRFSLCARSLLTLNALRGSFFFSFSARIWLCDISFRSQLTWRMRKLQKYSKWKKKEEKKRAHNEKEQTTQHKNCLELASAHLYKAFEKERFMTRIINKTQNLYIARHNYIWEKKGENN